MKKRRPVAGSRTGGCRRAPSARWPSWSRRRGSPDGRRCRASRERQLACWRRRPSSTRRRRGARTSVWRQPSRMLTEADEVASRRRRAGSRSSSARRPARRDGRRASSVCRANSALHRRAVGDVAAHEAEAGLAACRRASRASFSADVVIGVEVVEADYSLAALERAARPARSR